MESFFDRALVAARRLGASDVHLKPGLAPILRIGGELRTLSDVPPLSREFLQSLGHSLLNDRRREQLERTGEVVLAVATSNGGRQRVHVFHHRAGLGLSLRLVPAEPPKLETLGLPPEARALTEPGGGLVVIAGGASSGRTTTVAALLDDLVGQRPVRLVTIEDPVEYLLKDRRGVVVQREVGTDVPTVGAALRAAARQDLDVLAVSDVVDPDAAALVVDAARAGRLVLATLMATDVRDALDKLAALIGPAAGPAARARLAGVLRGILHQRLAVTGDGRKRSAAGVLWRVTPEARAWIATPGGDGQPEGAVPFEPGPAGAPRNKRAPGFAAAVEDDALPD
ncbi:MAG TPA: ATPase, T2SS/T4P/T4SS family [Polyangia bacterium]|nr:ATPase, T2SS/T4P/T4SS family [Polyangia bacterium]